MFQVNHQVLQEVLRKVINERRGVETGYQELDKMLKGLQGGKLYVLGGRPVMGKTTFALNLIHNISVLKEEPILYVSMEFSGAQLSGRLLQLVSGVDVNDLKGTAHNEGEWHRVNQAMREIASAGVYVEDASDLTVEQLGKMLRSERAGREIKLIVIDYLQMLISAERFQSRQEEMSYICGQLKKIARELNVPIVALSQLSRAVEQRPDHRPFLSDLRDSGAIEQYADVVMFLYRDDYYFQDSERKGCADIIISKNRTGPVGEIELGFCPEKLRFYNV